ncbi:hypothetical protein CP49_40480 [Bradyrhizobium valentinum]|uniref:Uncharacterized protein n=1 Tax=Bradyrhizobium valentinum TaxID=1518501 RepID=A0A0R3L2Y6_9BRAD|nr:hypothetical protein CP49_40480 [Bradyrhizobium valentinum]
MRSTGAVAGRQHDLNFANRLEDDSAGIRRACRQECEPADFHSRLRQGPLRKQQFFLAGLRFKEGYDDHDCKRSARRASMEDWPNVAAGNNVGY